MIYIELPDKTQRELSFYLAMEEFVAREKGERDAFFMWQVEPSVIFGRNQLLENEVNLHYCKTHHIRIFRRKSGGGCVYADRNNVMFSYITSDDHVGFVYNRYIQMVLLMLRKLGVEAHASGRNDIMIGDRKVSGNAFYKVGGRSVVHGTMLFDTNLEHMAGAITPSGDKLLSKGVQSVRQRVALLKDYVDISLESFMRSAREQLCTGTMVLTPSEVERIKEIEQEYLSDEFIYGHNPRYSVVHRKRIEGVGDFVVTLELKNHIIKKVDVKGDFFLTGDIGEVLKGLQGVPLEAETLREALPEHLDDIVYQLSREQFIQLLLDKS